MLAVGLPIAAGLGLLVAWAARKRRGSTDAATTAMTRLGPRRILDASPSGLILLDPDGAVFYRNQAATDNAERLIRHAGGRREDIFELLRTETNRVMRAARTFPYADTVHMAATNPISVQIKVNKLDGWYLLETLDVTDRVDNERLLKEASTAAVALETARAGQLESAVRAAERERDVAQMLHRSLSAFAASLEPEEVGRTLVETVVQVLSADIAVVLRCADHDTLTVVASTIAEGVPDTIPAGPIDAVMTAALLNVATRGGGRDPLPAALSHLLSAQTRAWLAIPLVLRGEHRGLLLAGTRADRSFSDAEAEIAVVLAGQGMAALDNAILYRRVQDLATKDGLTGLYNRRHFADFGRRLINHERNSSSPVTALMVDIDHFKTVNDTYGHCVGDEVIREVARRLQDSFRQSDLVCRYGGEEFAVLLPDTTGPIADQLALRAHAAVSNKSISTLAGSLPVTVSVGVAGAPAGDGDLDTLINGADKALYEAKRSGRNRVTHLPSTAATVA